MRAVHRVRALENLALGLQGRQRPRMVGDGAVRGGSGCISPGGFSALI